MALLRIEKIHAIAPREGFLKGSVDCGDKVFGVRGVICGEDEIGEGLKGVDCDCCTAVRVEGCNFFRYIFNFVADFNRLESEPFSPKSSLAMRDPADHHSEDLCLDSGDVVDDVVAGLVNIGRNKSSVSRQETEGDRLPWMSKVSASCKGRVQSLSCFVMPKNFRGFPHSSGIVLDGTNNYVA